MDLNTAQYIVDHHRHLITFKEAAALKHGYYAPQLASEASETLIDMYYKKNWLTRDPEILSLLEGGIEHFKLQLARRILTDHPNRVFMNICPRCAKLARTSLARQCRYCYYSWHHHTVGKIKLKVCAQTTNQSFVLLAALVSGFFENGHYLDLTMIDINYQLQIKNHGPGLHKTSNEKLEDIGFPVDELPMEEKILLQQKANSHHIIDIISEKRV